MEINGKKQIIIVDVAVIKDKRNLAGLGLALKFATIRNNELRHKETATPLT